MYKKIRKGDPPPSREKTSRFADLFDSIKDGQYVILDNWNEVNSFRMYCYSKGYKPIQRLQNDGTYHVWKGQKRTI